ncbi:MAG: serine kinase [Deltaproteobacteria bacterium]|nr:serine kinase [Deltaproteobacteria bacterium]MBW2345177.1 serine kinase [Deltaproteobacteria bacterium]
MKLSEIIEKLQLEIRTGANRLDVDVTRGYASDLMSDVMANANEGDLWVTLQIHQNIVAVAVMRSLAGIILVNGREPDAETIKKAEAEEIPIMISTLPTFELVGKLFEMGISGI